MTTSFPSTRACEDLAEDDTHALDAAPRLHFVTRSQSHGHNDLERLLGPRLDPDYPISVCPSQDLALDRPFDRVVG